MSIQTYICSKSSKMCANLLIHTQLQNVHFVKYKYLFIFSKWIAKNPQTIYWLVQWLKMPALRYFKFAKKWSWDLLFIRILGVGWAILVTSILRIPCSLEKQLSKEVPPEGRPLWRWSQVWNKSALLREGSGCAGGVGAESWGTMPIRGGQIFRGCHEPATSGRVKAL